MMMRWTKWCDVFLLFSLSLSLSFSKTFLWWDAIWTVCLINAPYSLDKLSDSDWFPIVHAHTIPYKHHVHSNSSFLNHFTFYFLHHYHLARSLDYLVFHVEIKIYFLNSYSSFTFRLTLLCPPFKTKPFSILLYIMLEQILRWTP